MLRIWLSFAQEMLSQRDALFYWIPVFIAVGIGIFFSLSFEPSIFSLTFCAVLGMGLWAVGLFFDTVDVFGRNFFCFARMVYSATPRRFD